MGLALVAHVVGVLVFGLFGALERLDALSHAPSTAQSSSAASTSQEDDRPMEIETIVNQLDRPEEKSAEEQLREEQVKKEESEKNPKGQVVDLPTPAIEERPDNAEYLAEHDSKVDRETKGPEGRDKAGAAGAMKSPEGRDALSMHAQPVMEKGSGQKGAPGQPAAETLASRETKTPDRPAGLQGLEELPSEGEGEFMRSGQSGAESHHKAETHPRMQSGQGGSPGAPGANKPNLVASPEMLERAIGHGAGSLDYLKNVDDGESTALNAKKWKHSGFFNRIKRAVADEWHPDVVYIRHDPSGNVYGVKDRVTVLRVHLHPDGKLAAWTIMQSCGVDFLDDEAIDAFRKAAPFPNPPKELVESDNQIHFNFAFIFELSGKASLKVFKYQ